MGSFDGKVVLVTGGSKGIGRTTALAFAREGAKVVVTGRGAEEGQATVKMIETEGGQGLFFKSDVSKASDCEGMVTAAVETFGRLDVAFNNAGYEGTPAPLADQTDENYEKIMNVNVKGLWLSLKFEIRQMLKNGGGTIVNNSSIAGLIGFPASSLYCASKHAVVGMTRTAAIEYARLGIRVNCVCPAAIETEMLSRLLENLGGEDAMRKYFAERHPIGRTGRPEEVTSAVLWLASSGSSFVTGHALAVDGGYTIQ